MADPVAIGSSEGLMKTYSSVVLKGNFQVSDPAHAAARVRERELADFLGLKVFCSLKHNFSK